MLSKKRFTKRDLNATHIKRELVNQKRQTQRLTDICCRKRDLQKHVSFDLQEPCRNMSLLINRYTQRLTDICCLMRTLQKCASSLSAERQERPTTKYEQTHQKRPINRKRCRKRDLPTLSLNPTWLPSISPRQNSPLSDLQKRPRKRPRNRPRETLSLSLSQTGLPSISPRRNSPLCDLQKRPTQENYSQNINVTRVLPKRTTTETYNRNLHSTHMCHKNSQKRPTKENYIQDTCVTHVLHYLSLSHLTPGNLTHVHLAASQLASVCILSLSKSTLSLSSSFAT